MAAAASTMEVEEFLPGFRFHPTEGELLDFYLARVALGKKFNFDIIGRLNIYRHDPWDLPAMAKMGEREWYFFVPRGRRAGSGGRPNRTTERGFWKATGSDRPIRSTGNPKRVMGLKKTLVFYQGRAPRGTKTGWVMKEYRLPDGTAGKEDVVLCKIYRKATPLKELEQSARSCSPVSADVSASDDYLSSSDDVQNGDVPFHPYSSSAAAHSGNEDTPREAEKEACVASVTLASASSLPQAANAPSNFQLPVVNPPCSLQLPPAVNRGELEWLYDPLLTQLLETTVWNL